MPRQGGQAEPVLVDATKDAEKVTLPPSDDEDMDTEGKTAKRHCPVSPTAASGASGREVLVSIDALRDMLAEQTANLWEKQKGQMTDMFQDLRAKMKGTETMVMAEVKQQQAQLTALQHEQAGVLERLQKLETKPSHGASSTASTSEPNMQERHRYTAIFRGWPRDTQRSVIIDQVHNSLRQLQVSHLTDFPTFVTGPRRSMSLMAFRVRDKEEFADMRARMNDVIQAVNRAKVVIQGGKRMWAAFSKRKEDREMGCHAALIRRVTRAIAPEQEDQLEPEYNTGSVWYGEYKFCSTSVPAEGILEEDLRYMDAQEGNPVVPWINVGAMARALKVTVKQVDVAIKAERRDR